ncbi:MAG: B12-binding domain-containing radical SAM protein [Planctomycetes bacterium]|nr:B12-binding domain-containing radical SAM protein [Planctomycetota bacterium]
MWIKLVSPRMSLRPVDSAFKTHMAPPLALLVLGALTPWRHTVTIADENVERVRHDDRPDMVGITVKVDTAHRSNEIARQYRERGVPVVYGGIHPTACPEACLPHCDAVVVGEAETLWASLVDDAEAGRLKRVYRAAEPPDPALTPVPRWELIAGKNYLFSNTLVVGRGCPWRCDFCYSSAANFVGGYRMKPLENVLVEIASLGIRHVMFIDDNFIGNPARARRLVEALAPLGLTWHAAVSADVGHHEDLLDAMAAAGCKSLFIGFETINPANLASCRKSQNRVQEYDRTIAAIHRRGMMVDASLVFGFDGDTADVFEHTMDWLVSRRIETMTGHILTPYPGTPLYERLLREGRIIDHDLRHYNTSHVVFRPAQMSPELLREGYLWMYREFYSWRTILERLPDRADRLRPYLAFNLVYRKAAPVASLIARLGLMGPLGRLGKMLSYWQLRGTLAAGAVRPKSLPTEAVELGEP